MPGKQISFLLSKLEIHSQQTEVLEAHGLIKFIHVYTFQKTLAVPREIR